MIEINNNDLRFRLNILGYEFPDSRDDWDSNWLLVFVELRECAEICFSKTDPCLLTMDLISLKDWLQSVSVDNVTQHKLSFMEPEISFEFSNDKVNLVLKYNFNPDGSQNDGSYRLHIDNHYIGPILESLEELLQKFPVRNNL